MIQEIQKESGGVMYCGLPPSPPTDAEIVARINALSGAINSISDARKTGGMSVSADSDLEWQAVELGKLITQIAMSAWGETRTTIE
jgi:hypothetical protein